MFSWPTLIDSDRIGDAIINTEDYAPEIDQTQKRKSWILLSRRDRKRVLLYVYIYSLNLYIHKLNTLHQVKKSEVESSNV